MWRDGLRPKEGVDLDKQVDSGNFVFYIYIRSKRAKVCLSLWGPFWFCVCVWQLCVSLGSFCISLCLALWLSNKETEIRSSSIVFSQRLWHRVDVFSNPSLLWMDCLSFLDINSWTCLNIWMPIWMNWLWLTSEHVRADELPLEWVKSSRYFLHNCVCSN